MTCAALRSVRVVSTCTWRGASFFVSHRVTCRIGNTPPWSSMGTSTTVSARCQVYSRPLSPVKAMSVNCSAGRSGMVPLRQVSGSNPAAAMCANRAGDHPPRSKPTRTRRSSPTAVRSSGSNRASSPARDAPGSDITTRTGPPSPPATQVSTVAGAGLVLYVDGHVRAYQGTKRIGKTHLSRLRFPAPATVETWVAGGDGGPVLVVMSEPGASLAGELARLLPELRTAVGDDRRVLVGFDRGGWSPALFAHMAAAGFDPLTWRKGTIPDLPAEQFTDMAFTGDSGREYTWHLADTVVEVPIDDHGGVFPMRQVTRWDTKKLAPRQVHVLTTRTDLSAAQVIYRMGARWRLENYFRYARMHFDLDSHHCYASADDDAQRLVPNPAKRAARLDVQAARARHDRAQGRTDAAMLAARSPAPGTQTILTNPVHDAITADLRAAGADLAAAQQAHKTIPTRVPLGELHPGQQVLDVETKLITHAISAAAFNTINALARDIRINTGYARANHEAHTLARHVLTHSGDIDPSDGVLTVRLDPMPTARATAAIRELCEHLTATGTRYPGTDLTLRYEIKTRP